MIVINILSLDYKILTSNRIIVGRSGCGHWFCAVLVFLEIASDLPPSLHDLVPLLDSGLRVLGALAGLRSELLDDVIAVAAFSLELHPSLLPPESFDLDLAGGVASGRGLRHLANLILVKFFLGEILLVLPVFNINGESLGGQEPEPLQRLRVKPDLGEGVLPVGEAQVHDHQPEVVREGVRDEEPRARQVLEPDLRLVNVATEQKG